MATVLWGLWPGGAAGESALERLEQRIRGEEAAAPSAPPAVRPLSRPGYLGLVADDARDRGRGVRVLEVRPDSPADKAGLKPDDLIVGVAEMQVRQMTEVAAILAQTPVGGRVKFEVLRGGQRQKMEVVLGPWPPADPRALPHPPAEDGAEASPEAKARIEALERRIAELEKRVADLEATLRDLILKAPKR